MTDLGRPESKVKNSLKWFSVNFAPTQTSQNIEKTKGRQILKERIKWLAHKISLRTNINIYQTIPFLPDKYSNIRQFSHFFLVLYIFISIRIRSELPAMNWNNIFIASTQHSFTLSLSHTHKNRLLVQCPRCCWFIVPRK